MRFENKIKVRVSLEAPDNSIDYVNSIIKSLGTEENAGETEASDSEDNVDDD